MGKYKITILFAVLFTIPLLGYFIVNGYWWLYNGNVPVPSKMSVSGIFGFTALILNLGIWATEGDKL